MTTPVPRNADRNRSLLLVIDHQEAFRSKLHQEERTIAAAARVVEAAALLGVPILVTEQYPERLGATFEEIAAVLPAEAPRIAKRTFSCWGAEGFAQTLADAGRDQIVLIGLEAHICVSQTAHDLLEHGYQVHAVRDAISSRFELESEQGYAKMIGSGCIPGSAESVLFEWLEDSRTPEFKAVQRLVL